MNGLLSLQSIFCFLLLIYEDGVDRESSFDYIYYLSDESTDD